MFFKKGGLILLVVFFFGGIVSCAPMRTIKIDKDFEMPDELDFSMTPVNAIGTEIITVGTDKKTIKGGFNIEKKSINGLDAISIEKNEVKVTVAHVNFDFMKKKYGLIKGVKHLLDTTYTNLGYAEAPIYDALYIPLYRVDYAEPYQMFYQMPFYHPIKSIYRNDVNKEFYNTFRHKFAEGKVTLSPMITAKKTHQEFKAWMEDLILGQPYASGYYKNYLVFFVTVENRGKEKIRLWPEVDSVVLDLDRSAQYRALSKEIIIGKDFRSYSEWKQYLEAMPKGKENPLLGAVFTGDREGRGVTCGYIYTDLPMYKAGLKANDIIYKFNDKSLRKELNNPPMKKLFKEISRVLPGQEVKISYLREGIEYDTTVKLVDADQWPRKSDITILGGGSVYPGVEYDGLLVFDTVAMMNNYTSGSEIKLIIPSIGTEFDANGTAIHSFDFEFMFRMP